MKKKSKRAKDPLNAIYLVGQVVDMYFVQDNYLKVRLKLSPSIYEGSKTNYVIISNKSLEVGHILSLICQIGNIIYVEGEFMGTTGVVVATYAECLLRLNKDDISPFKTIDDFDPSLYAPKVKIPRRKNSGKKVRKSP